MSEIVERLRAYSRIVPLVAEAADRIEQLEAALESIASRFDWAEHRGSIEWQTREEARAALARKHAISEAKCDDQ
jgi:TPP-dependent trihydroxycyclohexane-1,2-dione (THcHDO) dehydratase